ncbi:hypothetical protein DFQ14_101282 [Halopolyspora algeriensis]|uniref:Uncharacterized protein n=1 Tax=Halopolyspora algeriensis TaxID=1500506 RepID=A0A368VZZ3_9ACTN|nr:hypothetical protein [Halopolyspora algeriensis]RCW46942.1 hypothetical protein DFQ14_101282 [Halopolyspora algeriensis]TQM48033.1 hypothetical protein FHU43_2985 [Halopolyspora algeriensis]
MTAPSTWAVPDLHPEVWPRWLPAPHLRDRTVHLAEDRNGPGLCGQPVMWAKPGHPCTQRPCCPDCLEAVATGEGQ